LKNEDEVGVEVRRERAWIELDPGCVTGMKRSDLPATTGIEVASV
jgi:hypothetical protein